MKRIKRLIVLITLVVLGLAVWQPAAAQIQQQSVTIDSMVVNLWPEYDRPSMLVIYEIFLDESTIIPNDLVFQIPADAELVVVAGRQADGKFVLLNPEVTLIGDWQDVQFSADSLEIQIEFYDPNLIKQEKNRFYEFQWLSIYPINTFSLVVRQPFGASEVETVPELLPNNEGGGGMQFYSNQFGEIPKGESFTLTIRYNKDTANLSYPALEVQPADPIDADTPGRAPSPISVAFWLLAVAVAVLMMVGLYYWWFRVNISQKSDRIIQGVGIVNPEKQAMFCHECGMRSKAGDSFCRNCGTELHQPSDIEKAFHR